MSDIQSGNMEYERVVRLTKDVRGFNDAPTFYIADLSTTILELTLQNSVTKELIEGFQPINIAPTLIESPIGGASPNPGNENKVVIEFIVNKPEGEIPEGANYFVEWEDELGGLDWFELYISDKTSEEIQEVFIPY